jgi:outer membrane protein assembly factor BamB
MEEVDFTFDDFSSEMQDYDIKKTRNFDRMWKIGFGGSILQIPEIHGDLIYFGSCNKNVYAIDIWTGLLRWKFHTQGIILESSPTHWNGNIYIGSFDYNLYCLDAQTGELKWKFKTEGEIDSKPSVNNGIVYFGSKDHNVYALDAMTGMLRWKFQTRDEISASPTVACGKVFIGSFDKNFYCLDADTGHQIWKLTTQGENHNMHPSLVHEGVVYFGSFDNNLRAVDAETGSLLWKFPTGIYGNAGSPVHHNGVFYHASRDGHLFALTSSGEQLWKHTRREPFGVPVIHDDKIILGNEDFNLYCLSLEGKQLWSFRTEGFVYIQPAVHAGRVFFTSWDCNLYCLDIETQQLVWKFKADGGPSFIPPPYEGFEMEMKISKEVVNEDEKKRYDIGMAEEDDREGAYKSRVTYQMSTQYQAKGKYQTDSDEEAF